MGHEALRHRGLPTADARHERVGLLDEAARCFEAPNKSNRGPNTMTISQS